MVVNLTRFPVDTILEIPLGESYSGIHAFCRFICVRLKNTNNDKKSKKKDKKEKKEKKDKMTFKKKKGGSYVVIAVSVRLRIYLCAS
jgi:transposase